jgi:hypothetical protein
VRLLFEQLLNGFAVGSIYALITLGLALVYGIMRILLIDWEMFREPIEKLSEVAEYERRKPKLLRSKPERTKAL